MNENTIADSAPTVPHALRHWPPSQLVYAEILRGVFSIRRKGEPATEDFGAGSRLLVDPGTKNSLTMCGLLEPPTGTEADDGARLYLILPA